MAYPEGVRQKDTPTPRYNHAELVGSLFSPQMKDISSFDWGKFSPKEVINTIKGIVYQKAAQRIVHDLVTPHDRDSAGTEQMQGFNFIPTTTTDTFPLPDKTWGFDSPSDLSTDGDPDFVKIQRYVVGLFRDYAEREFDSLGQAHPLVVDMYYEADRRFYKGRRSEKDRRFTALDLGIEAICGVINSSFQEAEIPDRPPALQILGGSMPLLISIARESIEGKGDPNTLGRVALEPDPRQKEKATAAYRSAFMQLSVDQAVRLLFESFKDLDNFTTEFQNEYQSSVLELSRRLGALTANGETSLADLATVYPQVNDMLSEYITMEGSHFYPLAYTIRRMPDELPQLHDAYVVYLDKHLYYDQTILNPEFFSYSEDVGGFVHKLDDQGYSLYWKSESHAGDRLVDIVPQNVITGCAGLMFNVRPEDEQENAYWSAFPRIMRNPIGLATTIAYMAAREFVLGE